LKIEEDDDSDVSVHFDRKNKGARDWATLVDGFATALEALHSFGHADGVKWYTPGAYLGRGAVVRLPWRSLVLAVGLWLEQGPVYRALKRGALKVTSRGKVPRGVLKLGPRYLEVVRERYGREDEEHVEEME
jgi:hypothetical protein